MIQIVTHIFGLVSIVVSFFSPLWGWIILALPSLFLIITLFGLKQKKWSYVPELSPKANQMIRKFGHFYNMPFAGTDFSASATTLMFVGIILAIIGLFHKFWWGIAISAVNWVVMAFVSRAFNPSFFLVDDEERFAHEEIIFFIRQKLKERRSKINNGD
jgi:hypothetical protein